jgi:alcohol dehydrogenase (cytochrome c)
MYLPTVEGCNALNTSEQKDFIDQGGTVRPRDRFTGGGSAKLPNERRYGALKAIDPVTGETKAVAKLPYPNYGGALATAGSLVFNGGIDGHFAAYDGKTMNELWSFDAGTGIQAPPVTFSINGKQYIAILAGARQNPVIINDYPELRNTSPASMLYVFSL